MYISKLNVIFAETICNMTNKLIINEGSVYGKFTVIKEAEKRRLPSGQVNRFILCKCECGVEKEVRMLHLVRGRIKSCGCVPYVRGRRSSTFLYKKWRSMKERCMENAIDSNSYFKIGISVCKEWETDFFAFEKWAKENGAAKDLQLDRIKTELGYSPSNCRFVTAKINQNNKRNTFFVEYNGENEPISIVLDRLGKMDKYRTIMRRIERGWDAQKAIDFDIRKGNYSKI